MCTPRFYNKGMSYNEPSVVTTITSAPARRKVQEIFYEQIPDASRSLLKKKNYEDARSVLLQCTIGKEIVGGLLALHPTSQFDENLRPAGMSVKGDFPELLATRTILNVAVVSKYQHMGIGRELVERAEKAFAEAGATTSIIFVDSKSPESTHHFWKKMGYTAGDANESGGVCTGLPPEARMLSIVPQIRAGTAYYRHLNSTRKSQATETTSTQSQAAKHIEAATSEAPQPPRNWLRRWLPLFILSISAVAIVSILISIL